MADAVKYDSGRRLLRNADVSCILFLACLKIMHPTKCDAYPGKNIFRTCIRLQNPWESILSEFRRGFAMRNRKSVKVLLFGLVFLLAGCGSKDGKAVPGEHGERSTGGRPGSESIHSEPENVRPGSESIHSEPENVRPGSESTDSGPESTRPELDNTDPETG